MHERPRQSPESASFCTCGGLSVHDRKQLESPTCKGDSDFLQREDLTQGAFDAVNAGAEALCHLGKSSTEIAMNTSENRVVGFYQVGQGGFHPRCPRSGKRKGPGILSLEYETEQVLLFAENPENYRIEVPEGRRAQRT